MNTGLLQQQPLLNGAVVRSAPTQQHGAHMSRSSVPEGGKTANIPDEEKRFRNLLKR